MVSMSPEVTQATDRNIDPSCTRTMDPDMTLSNSLGPDDFLSLGGSTGYSHQDDTGDLTIPRHQEGHRLYPWPWGFCVTFGSSTDPGFGGTMDPDIVLSSS